MYNKCRVPDYTRSESYGEKQRTKASTRLILVQMYNIFRLLIGVPDYSSSESYGWRKTKTGEIGIRSERGLYKYIKQAGTTKATPIH